MKRPPIILSIAGSDCSGGAGIQADIKTISAIGGYAASAITAITVQNTLGVQAVQTIPTDIVRRQIEVVMEDLQPDAIKIGMVDNMHTVRVIADCLRKFTPTHVVFDPVMVSTSGRKLMPEETIEEIKKELFPFITLLTPNLDEATVLTGRKIDNQQAMQEAAKELMETYHINILVKGGHLIGEEVNDLLYTTDGSFYIYKEKKIESTNLHGTGCTLSSAIATYLALGNTMQEAVRLGKAFTLQSILAGKDLHIGHGNGPLWHFPEPVAQMCTFCAVVS